MQIDAVKDSKQKVPKQETGTQSDVKHSVDCDTNEAAAELFKRARKNLFNINRWHKLAGKLSAHFYLTDRFGNEVDRGPLPGNYIKIHLPSSRADKFEWVVIEKVEEENPDEFTSRAMIRVRPSEPPRPQEETEHFFSAEATSNFFVERRGRRVTAEVRGRNELPNLERSGLINKIRNVIIAGAAMAGVNVPQWKALAKGMLEK